MSIAPGLRATSAPIPLPSQFPNRRSRHTPRPRADASLDDIQRDIIDFDFEGPEGAAFLAFTKATGLSRFVDIPWPKGLAPTPAARAPAGGAKPLPRADVLIVTWTVDEGHALSRVLTPGKDSRDDYVPYTHNFATLASQMSKGSPAVKAKRLGTFWTTTIGAKKVVVFKSESHLSQDTNKHFPANGISCRTLNFGSRSSAKFSRSWCSRRARPEESARTSRSAMSSSALSCASISTSWLKKATFRRAHYASDGRPDEIVFAGEGSVQGERLAAAPGQHPSAGDHRRRALGSFTVGRHDRLLRLRHDGQSFQASGPRRRLRNGGRGFGHGGPVARDGAPPWLAIRNVSDPEIAAEGTIKQQAQAAATIYKAYGRWSSVCSAIVCWAAVAALSATRVG